MQALREFRIILLPETFYNESLCESSHSSYMMKLHNCLIGLNIYMLIWFPIIVYDTFATNYCELCDIPGSHTLCKYKKLPSNCKNEFPLTSEEKQQIVRVHNKWRNAVALGMVIEGPNNKPLRAANMMQLTWDNELATIAQHWANQCKLPNNESRRDDCRDVMRFRVGQNVKSCIKHSREPEVMLESFLEWFNEIKNFDRNKVKSYSEFVFSKPNLKLKEASPQVPAYSQIVWANTYLVGCGRAIFPIRSATSQKLLWIHRMVCNYGPTGNIEGEPVYKIGKPCLACPTNTRCSIWYRGLCTSKAGDNDLTRLSSFSDAMYDVDDFRDSATTIVRNGVLFTVVIKIFALYISK